MLLLNSSENWARKINEIFRSIFNCARYGRWSASLPIFFVLFCYWFCFFTNTIQCSVHTLVFNLKKQKKLNLFIFLSHYYSHLISSLLSSTSIQCVHKPRFQLWVSRDGVCVLRSTNSVSSRIFVYCCLSTPIYLLSQLLFLSIRCIWCVCFELSAIRWYEQQKY